MSAIELYLEELDTSTTLNSAGTFSGISSELIPSTDVILYYGAPIADILGIWSFTTDGVDDLADEKITMSAAQANNFIGGSTAIAGVGSVATLYVANESSTPVYTPNVVNDISVLSDALVPDGARNFVGALSTTVFGSEEAIDFFNNPTALKTSYGTAVETCCAQISSKFAAVGTATIYSSLASSTTNLKVGKKIYDQLKFSAPERFGLLYNMTIANGVEGQYSNTTVTATTGSGSLATVTVDVGAGGGLDNMQVLTEGSGYASGDSITITLANSGGTITNIINPVAAAILNGSLTSSTNLPLEINDVFNIQLTIQSHPDQTDSEATVIALNGNTVSQTAKLIMKLISTS